MLVGNNTGEFSSNIAIVICTYNPEQQIFSRTLKSIEQLEIPIDMKVECVIVDNNSSTPVAKLPYVQSFLENCSWAKVITESKQGLTFARITGVCSTIAPIIIFVDDDNEVAKDYLKATKNCLEQYMCIAALGPGKIHVEFIDPVSEWFDKNFRIKFQERDNKYIEYGCVMARWESFYPFGTGLIIRREVYEKYYQGFQSGNLASTDRTAGSLSSGGDIQIVWEAVKMGLTAGVSPELKVTHLIPQKRANLDYVKRLTFGAASSYIPALIASFPSEKENTLAMIPSNKAILRRILNITIRRIAKLKYKILLVDLADYCGQLVGMLRAAGIYKTHFLYHLVRILKFE